MAVATALEIVGAAHAASDIQQQLKSTEEYNNVSAEELYAMVKIPTRPIEILENIKFALDHDLILREDFYATENLHNFFSIENPSMGSTESGQKDIWVRTSNFGGRLFKPVKFRSSTYPGAQLVLSFKSTELGKVHASIGLSISGLGKVSELNFDAVEKIFGKNWKLDRTAPLHGPNPPATAPHGNDIVTYVVDNCCIKRTISIAFYGDGSLSDISIREEAK